MKTKTTIEVNPVSWAGQKVLKHQAFAKYTVGERTLRISGDPQDHEETALKSLVSELALWKNFIRSASERLAKRIVEPTKEESDGEGEEIR